MPRKIFTIAEQRRIDRMSESGDYTRVQIAEALGVDAKTLRNHMAEVAGVVAPAGRPSKLDAGKSYRVYLGTDTVDAARTIGNGNLSDGIRTAVAIAANATKRK